MPKLPQILIELPNEPKASAPWRYGQVVHALRGCALLSVEISIPFGETPSQELVEAWVRENLPSFCERYGSRMRWHVLLSRNTPEGLLVRLLLVVSPKIFDASLLCVDSVLPMEFSLLGAAEAEASQHGGNFVWIAQLDSTLHWLVSSWALRHRPRCWGRRSSGPQRCTAPNSSHSRNSRLFRARFCVP